MEQILFSETLSSNSSLSEESILSNSDFRFLLDDSSMFRQKHLLHELKVEFPEGKTTEKEAKWA